MRKRRSGLHVLFLLLFFLLGCRVSAAESNIYDQAELFTEEQELRLSEKADALKSDYDMNVILVTTDDAEGKEARDYADDFYMDHGFYDNGAKGGILYLIDMDNREVYLCTQGDMIYYCTDSRISEIIDVGYEQLGEGNYAGCIENMIAQTRHYMEEGIPSDQYTYDEETGKIVRYRSLKVTEIIISVLISLAAAGITCGAVVGKYRLKWGGYVYPFKEKGKVTLRSKEDRFTNQVVTTRKIPKNPPSSSGGGGGGRSTIHTSSGGGSFGGGGRKF